MVKLRIKQQRFANEYLISRNIEQYAIAAGYSKKYARGRSHELLANVGVKKYIGTRLEALQSEKVADQQEIMEWDYSELESVPSIGI